MIYGETIENEGLWAEFSRQKNEVDSEWYGLTFTYTDKDGEKIYCDNDVWITETLNPLTLDMECKSLRAKLGVDWSKKDFKKLRKLVIEVDKSGWFFI